MQQATEYQERAAQIVRRIEELGRISERNDCLARMYGTAAFISARLKVAQWMGEAGLEIRIDNIGNVRGRLQSNNPAAKTFVIGSHIDTVVNAGKWDGPLGVIMGIEIAASFSKEKIKLPFHLEVVGFCDEEGCRFHTTYLGSRSLAGSFEDQLLSVIDASGTTLRSAIEACGGHVDQIKNDAIGAAAWEGYFEIHIEQGPVLCENDLPVGVVTSIAGQYRVVARFIGEAGHAGTVPMNLRKDALVAAAEFITEVEAFAIASNKTNGKAPLVATVGKLEVANAAGNVIPGDVLFTLDLRSSDEGHLSHAFTHLHELAKSIAEKRKVQLEWRLVLHSGPVEFDPVMKDLLSRSVGECGFETLMLASGAGHDAVPVSSVAPVSMLFVRCANGISHNPLENVETRDVCAALAVSETFMRHLIRLKRG